MSQHVHSKKYITSNVCVFRMDDIMLNFKFRKRWRVCHELLPLLICDLFIMKLHNNLTITICIHLNCLATCHTLKTWQLEPEYKKWKPVQLQCLLYLFSMLLKASVFCYLFHRTLVEYHMEMYLKNLICIQWHHKLE